MACLLFFNAPTAEALVQPKAPIAIDVMAVSRLEICKPITRNVDEGCDASTQYSRSDQDDPHLAGIRKLLQITQYTRCASI
jgi:hypothetical protein